MTYLRPAAAVPAGDERFCERQAPVSHCRPETPPRHGSSREYPKPTPSTAEAPSSQS